MGLSVIFLFICLVFVYVYVLFEHFGCIIQPLYLTKTEQPFPPLYNLIYSASIIALSTLRHESRFNGRLMQKAMKSRAFIASAFAFQGLLLEGG